jgi:hypothetical protein
MAYLRKGCLWCQNCGEFETYSGEWKAILFCLSGSSLLSWLAELRQVQAGGLLRACLPEGALES